MKIALINVSGRVSLDGSHLISALLKRAGHGVKMVLLARPEPLDYQRAELEHLDPILTNSDLVMIAVNSSYALRAVQVTEYVREKYAGMKVIWGGPHCISAPELGLRYADGVCFSEGDQAVVELVDKMEKGVNYLHVPNMAFNMKSKSVINEVLPPFSDLDNLPYYDQDLEDHFLLDQSLIHMTKERLRERLFSYPFYIPILYFITSRGCPHNCSYCNNCRYISMFGRNTMRFFSVDRVIDELKYTLERFDFYQIVGFTDDDFFMRPKNQLAEFANKYKKEIGLPFGIQTSPTTFRKNKLELLLDAGLRLIQMGVQSGSQRILDDVFNRKISTTKTKTVLNQIEQYHRVNKLDLLTDFIVDNPYETKEDIIQTYRFLVDMPHYVKFNLFFLAFFPGTPIYDRALKDGFITPFSEETFRFFTRGGVRYQKNYEMLLILFIWYISRHPRLHRCIPRSLPKMLGTQPIRNLANIFPESLYAFLSKLIQIRI